MTEALKKVRVYSCVTKQFSNFLLLRFRLRFRSTFLYTLLQNHKLCPKFQFPEKFKKINWAEKQWILRIFKWQIYPQNLNFRAKIVILLKLQNQNNRNIIEFFLPKNKDFWKILNGRFTRIFWIFAPKFKILWNYIVKLSKNHWIFWRENSNSQLSANFENWIFGHNLRVFNSVLLLASVKITEKPLSWRRQNWRKNGRRKLVFIHLFAT